MNESDDVESGHGGADHGEQHEPPAADGSAKGIDIATLTAKVYRLMQDELRLERARGVAPRNNR